MVDVATQTDEDVISCLIMWYSISKWIFQNKVKLKGSWFAEQGSFANDQVMVGGINPSMSFMLYGLRLLGWSFEEYLNKTTIGPWYDEKNCENSTSRMFTYLQELSSSITDLSQSLSSTRTENVFRRNWTFFFFLPLPFFLLSFACEYSAHLVIPWIKSLKCQLGEVYFT